MHPRTYTACASLAYKHKAKQTHTRVRTYAQVFRLLSSLHTSYIYYFFIHREHPPPATSIILPSSALLSRAQWRLSWPARRRTHCLDKFSAASLSLSLLPPPREVYILCVRGYTQWAVAARSLSPLQRPRRAAACISHFVSSACQRYRRLSELPTA